LDIRLDNQQKIENIEFHVAEIMKHLGLDLNDDSLSGTPRRIAKMYVNDLFMGLNENIEFKTTSFDNKYKYGGILLEKNISVFSMCEHHFMPMFGKAHVAYIPNDKVIGLSKINRIVNMYARQPQVQERLTLQIADGIAKAIGNDNVAVMIDCVHLCIAARGVQDKGSSTITSEFRGEFKKAEVLREFYEQIKA